MSACRFVRSIAHVVPTRSLIVRVSPRQRRRCTRSARRRPPWSSTAPRCPGSSPAPTCGHIRWSNSVTSDGIGWPRSVTSSTLSRPPPESRRNPRSAPPHRTESSLRPLETPDLRLSRLETL
eukprot:1189924-Prorocentrum_minimum.AAC.1